MSRIRCKCSLHDCAYFNPVGGIPGECDCSHPEKNFYMIHPCPLYRENWQAKQDDEKAAEIKARFLKRRV